MNFFIFKVFLVTLVTCVSRIFIFFWAKVRNKLDLPSINNNGLHDIHFFFFFLKNLIKIGLIGFRGLKLGLKIVRPKLNPCRAWG